MNHDIGVLVFTLFVIVLGLIVSLFISDGNDRGNRK